MRSPEPRLSLNSLRFVQDHFMAQTTPENHLEEDISIHIFTVSAAMVGVCLTVIGLIRVVITFGKADTVADDLLAVDAFFSSYPVCFPIPRYARARNAECIEESVSLIA